MKILVTGGAGFIGSNFIRLLINNSDYEVVNFDKLTYAGNLNNLRDIENNNRYKFIKGDICNLEDVKEAVKDCSIIVNFAAESHVDRSINDPSSFIKTDIFGAFNLLEEARKNNTQFVQISCYDKKTRALTTEGLKSYKKLKKGDIVFSLNPKTNEIELKPIEKVIVQDYNGKMFYFKNKLLDLCVTPNHKMFITDKNKKLIIETAEKASKRDKFYLPEGEWRGKNQEYFFVKGYGFVPTNDLMYILGIFIGDGFTAYQVREQETRSGLNKKDFLRIARDKANGRFIEIEKQGNHRYIGHSYRIFFDIPERDKCRNKVEKTLNNLNINYHKHKGRAGTHLYFTSKPFMELFDQCGKGAHNKHIPSWAINLAPKYLESLFSGLMDSDGSRQKIYFTVSKRLASDFCELSIKLNLKPTLRKRHTKTFFEGRKIEGSSYYIYVARNQKWINKHRVSSLHYKGKIWCLKVKDNKNFVVERNGKFDFCGNTDECYGQILEGSFTETSPLMPRNPYSASKTGADRLAYSYFSTYGLKVIITRSSNNFGPFQYPEKVIPLFVTNLLTGKKVPVYGTGKQIRDWLYVEDNCEGIKLCMEKGKAGEVYNIGGGNELQNIELTKLILKELNLKEDRIEFVEDRKGHDFRYSLNCDKIKTELGWQPKNEFTKALKKTIDWYKQNEWWWKPLIKN